MKTRILPILFFFILAFPNTSTFAQTTPGSIEYMSEMTGSLNETKDEIWQYLKVMTRGKGARKIDAKREKLLTELIAVKSSIKQMKAFNGDDSLRQAVLTYVDLDYTVLNEDYAKIIDMEEIAEQSYDLMEAYLLAKETANDKLRASYETMQAAQKKFAEKNNINLVDGEQDKTSEKIQKASETLKYYNTLYLIFFKSYKQEMYVLDAMSKNDINAFEQNTSALTIYSIEGTEKLKTINPFHNDRSLKAATAKMLTFYKNEAEIDFASMTDYYLKKDEFEKTQKAFDAISKKNRTQQDVDRFNKAVNDYNKAIETTNRIAQSSNAKREEYLNEWNKKVEDFFNTHAK